MEKRRHKRIPLSYVTLDIITITGEIKFTETNEIMDISESGMKFSTPNSYPSGFVLRVTFILPKTSLPIRTNVTIIHQLRADNVYHTGVQFKDMTLAEYSIIKTYIDKHLLHN